MRKRLFIPLLMALVSSGTSVSAGDWHPVTQITPSKQQPDPQPVPPLPSPEPAPAPAPKPPLVVPPPPDKEALPAPMAAPAPPPRQTRRIYFYDEDIPASVVHAAAPAPAAPVQAQVAVPVTYVTRWRLVSQRFAVVPVADPMVTLTQAPVQAAPLVVPPAQAVSASPQIIAAKPACRGPIMRTIDAGMEATRAWWR